MADQLTAGHKPPTKADAPVVATAAARFATAPAVAALRGLSELLSGGERVASLRALGSQLSSRAPALTKIQRAAALPPPNRTGLPDRLKQGMESLSGLALDDVRVHRNSDKPAQLQAYAYAQGTDIHLAPGQERHLPHEAWHVVQQKQGRVAATMQLAGGVPVNDDARLEREADVMGARALTPDTMLRQSTPGQAPARLALQRLQRAAAPIQRALTIGGQPVQAPNPGLEPAVEEIIEGWIAEGEHAFDTWEMATAVAWLDRHGWQVPAVDIVDPALTPRNCHGLTFGEDWVDVDTIAEFLGRWEGAGQPVVMLCLQHDQVAHSATLIGGMWQQTLPNGPVFRTDRAALEAHYQCFDLSQPDQLQAVQEMVDELNQTFADERDALMKRCFAATHVPENEQTERQSYEAGWYREAADMVGYSPENLATIRDRIEQLEDDSW